MNEYKTGNCQNCKIFSDKLSKELVPTKDYRYVELMLCEDCIQLVIKMVIEKYK